MSLLDSGGPPVSSALFTPNDKYILAGKNMRALDEGDGVKSLAKQNACRLHGADLRSSWLLAARFPLTLFSTLLCQAAWMERLCFGTT